MRDGTEFIKSVSVARIVSVVACCYKCTFKFLVPRITLMTIYTLLNNFYKIVLVIEYLQFTLIRRMVLR